MLRPRVGVTRALAGVTQPRPFPLVERGAVEALGTAFLLATIVGSGIMAERLAGGNAAITLLANALATGAGLVALLLAFEPISGAHLNPIVTALDAARGNRPWRELPIYAAMQTIGAFAGVAAAHGMFGLPLFSASHRERSGLSQGFSEAIATLGLVLVVFLVARARPASVPFAVAAYITAAYWFTASTSFANPAVALARAATDTFAGIRPTDVPLFLAGEAAGGFVGFLVLARLARG